MRLCKQYMSFFLKCFLGKILFSHNSFAHNVKTYFYYSIVYFYKTKHVISEYNLFIELSKQINLHVEINRVRSTRSLGNRYALIVLYKFISLIYFTSKTSA